MIETDVDRAYRDAHPSAELVKPPQSRRGKGWSVVYRQPGEPVTYIKRQSGYNTRVWWRGFRLTPRLTCEHRALRFCAKHNIPAPTVICFDETPQFCELIIADVGPAQEFDAFIQGCESEERLNRVIIDTATIIANLHSRRWVHGALGNDHILVREDDAVVLIDFEKAHLNPFRVSRDLERFWRRTDCLSGEQEKLFSETYESAMKSRG